MITNTKHEPIQEQGNEKTRGYRAASVFPQLHRSAEFSIFLAYAPVLICFLAVGVLLWHFERRTERDLESIRIILIRLDYLTREETDEVLVTMKKRDYWWLTCLHIHFTASFPPRPQETRIMSHEY